MPINSDEIMSVVRQLADHREMQVTVKCSAKGAAITAAGTFAGGLMLGPLGLAVGGIVSSLGAAMLAKNSFKPVSAVILEDMTLAQRTRLANSCMAVVQDLRAEDATILLGILMTNTRVQELVLKEVVAFIQNEMKLQIRD